MNVIKVRWSTLENANYVKIATIKEEKDLLYICVYGCVYGME